MRVHYKHCREIAQAIKGRSLENAKQYLTNVTQYTEAIPFTKYTGGIGRHSAAHKYKTPGDKVSWPQKATKTFIDLLTNITSNVVEKNLDITKVKITHAQANQAPKMRRRTYRAHGRINAYLSSPAHIEIIAEETLDEVVKESEESTVGKLTKKQVAQSKAKAIVAKGGGAN